MTAAPLRVVSLLPSATDTVLALDYGHVLVGRSHECDAPGLQHLPALTSSRVGNIPVDEIDAVMSASAAAVRELAQLGAALAVPLLEYGLCVYHLHLEQLQQLRPDVVLTCLQAAHGAVLSDGLLEAALHSVLGYAPRVVHCAAERLDGVWRDMQAVADGLEVPERGRAVVEKHRQHLADVAASARGRGSLRVAAIQWPQPLMACGAWVPEMIKMAGSQDVCGAVDHAEVVSEQQLGTAAPDVVIFALCGLTLEQSLQAARATIRRLADTWPSLPAARAGRVAVVDGEHVFSRPGPLLSQSMEVLMELMHPEVQPYGHQGFRPAKPRPRFCEPLRQHHEGRLPARTPGLECLRHRCQRWPPHQVCWLWRLSGRMQRGMGIVLRGRRACCRDRAPAGARPVAA